jgi:HD superfamily phosphohydrolase
MTTKMHPHIIFDPIYGFIKITSVEKEIINSVFYQRLRWIKQLGFSLYIFPGAEHSRFGHSIGAMYNAHCILKSCNLAVSNAELFDSELKTESATFHQSIRIGALLHDLGTFCFSHTTEASYVNFGETTNIKNGKKLKDDHEHLGSFIIKNTDYEGGITHILKKYGLNPQTISDLVKGIGSSLIANQILHSDIDCDRMDYLLRDAHYTGLKYGAYDRAYLLHHFQSAKIGNENVLTLKYNALRCIEDFIHSRFAWYSQVIRSPRGSKYDAVAEHVCSFLLEKKMIYRYSELLEMIANDPMRFYGFNDAYFMGNVHKYYVDGMLDRYPDIKNMAKAILYAHGVKHIDLPEFDQRLIDQEDATAHHKYLKQAKNKFAEIQDFIAKKGEKEHWLIEDIPKKDIMLVKSAKNIIKVEKSTNLLLERDPIKVLYPDGQIKLITDVENSTISKFHKTINFTPNVFCSDSTFDLLKRHKII